MRGAQQSIRLGLVDLFSFSLLIAVCVYFCIAFVCVVSVHIDDNNILSISGEQKQEHVEEAKNKRYLRVERSFGQIQRQLRLPRNINAKGVQASYQNGILHIDVPKVDIKETQTPVNIQ
jgi:HSP20 family molecular chaperone IbpA